MSDNVETARRVIASAATTLQPGQDAGAHYARALAEAGLLADPAQTTELEQLRARLDETQLKLAEADRLYADLLAQREQWWEHVGRERAQLEAERDERQTRIDRALVECDREYSLGRVPLNQIPTAAQICDRIRAALAGDQPTANDRLPLADRARMWCEGQALSGEALRNAEERDDAAGDLP